MADWEPARKVRGMTSSAANSEPISAEQIKASANAAIHDWAKRRIDSAAQGQDKCPCGVASVCNCHLRFIEVVADRLLVEHHETLRKLADDD